MKHYLKLVHMEIHRFRYMLAGLMALTAVVQLGTLWWQISRELSRLREEPWIVTGIGKGKMAYAQSIQNIPDVFTFPILLCIGLLVLYVPIIWYRDWVGRDTFIYRLLMLPEVRRHIYLAKLTAILLFVFALLTFELVVMLAGQLLFNVFVPEEMRIPFPFADAIAANNVLAMLLPHELDFFLLFYGLGTLGVLVLFTAVLIERAYRIPGMLYALLYTGVCVAAVVLPLSIMGIENRNAYLYPIEILRIQLVIILIVAAVTVWLGFRLLARKVTV